MKWQILSVALTSIFSSACFPFAAAQTGSSLAIRVESNQVLVPTFVFDKQRFGGIDTAAENRCVTETAQYLRQNEISVRQLPAKCWGGSIADLVPKEFRLFEDGAEQTIQGITRERKHWWQLYDNRGVHREYSDTPTGKWSTTDLGSTDWAPPSDVESYVIAYVPPQSATGSCHQIKVSVNRRDVVVFSRSEYCNLLHAPSDPLDGTKLGQQMQGNWASPDRPKIPMSVVAGVFFKDSGAPRLHLILEFPSNSLHREWSDGYGRLFATIGVLGMAYRKDGTLGTRFTDQACCSREDPFSDFRAYGGAGDDVYEIPARYETQMDLPPGDYDLRVVLSDGKKFGRTEIPLKIESHDEDQIALSSVALCKRFHRVDPPSFTEGILPSKFVALVSKGIEFTPSADPTFENKRDPLFAYFEIYAATQASLAAAGGTSAPKSQAEPQSAAERTTTVQFQLRVTNLATGKVQIDSGLRPTNEFLPAAQQPLAGGSSSAGAGSVASNAASASSVLHIVQEIATRDLPKGNYRLEVQASDSAGHRTPWHAATFAVR